MVWSGLGAGGSGLTNQIRTKRVFTGVAAFRSTVVPDAVAVAICLKPDGGLSASMAGAEVAEGSAAHISIPAPAVPMVTEAEAMFLAEPRSKISPVPFGFPFVVGQAWQ